MIRLWWKLLGMRSLIGFIYGYYLQICIDIVNNLTKPDFPLVLPPPSSLLESWHPEFRRQFPIATWLPHYRGLPDHDAHWQLWRYTRKRRPFSRASRNHRFLSRVPRQRSQIAGQYLSESTRHSRQHAAHRLCTGHLRKWKFTSEF